MRKQSWLLIAAWLAYCAAAASLFAATGGTGHFNIDVWNTETEMENPLPENTIISLTQTRDGYLWLGTFNGLVRFDGLGFTPFDESSTPGLDNSPVVCLFEDSQSNLWVGTQSAGVLLIRNGRVTSLPIGTHSREGRLMSACEDSTGAVWLYTANGQLYRDRNNKIDEWQLPQRESACRSMIVEKSGALWIGTDTILYEIDSKTNLDSATLPLLQKIALPQKLDFLAASASGGFWCLTGGQVQKFADNQVTVIAKSYLWTNSTVTCAREDLNGNLVVGTSDEGVWIFDAKGQNDPIVISHRQGLSHDTVLSVCVDHEGSLWVGTDSGGLNRAKRQVFQVVPPSLGTTVLSACEGSDGSIWFGQFGGGVSRWENGAVKLFAVEQGSTNGYIKNLGVRSVLVDHDQNVWVGADLGLLKLNPADNQYSWPPAFVNERVSAMYEDRSNRVWIGTQAGLVVVENGKLSSISIHGQLTSPAIRAIAEDKAGDLWFGTDGGGLNHLHNGELTALHKSDGLPSEHISALYADKEGLLWVGTASGLARWQNDEFTHYTTHDGLRVNSIDYITEDDEDCLWLGSNAGLMRIARKALNDFAAKKTNYVACRTFGPPDGLPTRECAQGSQPAALRARDGRLWFATIRGLVFVNPAEIQPNTNPPPVAIESVSVEGHEQLTNGIRAALPDLVTIPAGKEHVDIQYTSLNLAAPDKGRFRYRMAGHEVAWTEVDGHTREAHYTALPPGRYRFEITAGNEDGVWNETPASLAFVVEPPFWQKWWFVLLVALSALGAVVGVVHYLSTQRLQRQLEGMRQQQALEKERARIARDIHDQLGASMTQVSLLGEMVESDKDDPVEVEAHAKQISQTARDTSRVLDEIVWTVNPSNDTLEGLVNYICKYAQEYLAVADVRYRLDVPSQLPSTEISPELRHNVFLAAKEAVTNVVRHAKATEVWLRLRLEPARFILEIQDNGRGPVNLEDKQSRNGLRNMHKRMEDVGGNFALTAVPEGGALVRLTVPLNHS